jgi:hypothetical protein
MDKTKILVERAHKNYYPENASIYVTMLCVAEQRSVPNVSPPHIPLAVRLHLQWSNGSAYSRECFLAITFASEKRFGLT